MLSESRRFVGVIPTFVRTTCLRTMQFADRRTLIKGLSAEVARTFADAHFDYIYLDALHTEDGLVSDLDAWYPKLRPGGLMAATTNRTRGLSGAHRCG